MRILTFFLALAAFAPVFASAEEKRGGGDDLSGTWRIEIINGPSRGDHGVITLHRAQTPTPSPGETLSGETLSGETLSGETLSGETLYRGAMRFTDSRAGVTADEDCLVTDRGAEVIVRCKTDEPGWLPDDFDLKKTGPEEMRGPHKSAVSGDALFRRQAADLFS